MDCEEKDCVCLECAGSVPDGFCDMEQCDWCESEKIPLKECASFHPARIT
ncbi:hypothetical protein AGMMS49975_26020 [Clostridia bacterium]|nr:hypothetical protein AGMMS49975_26020 [Clostridia bacterium]